MCHQKSSKTHQHWILYNTPKRTVHGLQTGPNGTFESLTRWIDCHFHHVIVVPCVQDKCFCKILYSRKQIHRCHSLPLEPNPASPPRDLTLRGSWRIPFALELFQRKPELLTDDGVYQVQSETSRSKKSMLPYLSKVWADLDSFVNSDSPGLTTTSKLSILPSPKLIPTARQFQQKHSHWLWSWP